MDSEITTRLVDLFWEGLRSYSSEEWFAADSKEKEEILWHALEILDEPIDNETALDIFWQWADGLEEDSFIDFSGLTENLGAYDVRKEGESLAAYLDGVLITRSRSYDELLADIREYEKEAEDIKATPTFLVSWIIEARTPMGYIEDSKEVQANTASEAIATIQKQFPRARQLSAILIESASFAEEFKLVENLWN